MVVAPPLATMEGWVDCVPAWTNHSDQLLVLGKNLKTPLEKYPGFLSQKLGSFPLRIHTLFHGIKTLCK